MFDKEGFRATLAQRLMFAATGTSMALTGCSTTPENKLPDNESSAAVAASATASVAPLESVEPSASPASSPALSSLGSLPKPKPVDFQAQCGAGKKGEEQCYEPHSVMRSQGTGEPAPRLPASAYDSNGCLANKNVTSGCCETAIAGPRFDHGQCCYGFCGGMCCGRPFYVDQQARVATLIESADWVSDSIVKLDQSREAAADAWLADALLEHASIASFSRFTLQLLALGAPAELVQGACAAGLDEVRHAELCFDMAARLSQRARGPAPLPMAGVSLDDVRLEDVVHSAVVEGCVGETVAAVIAAERCAVAGDPFARSVLARIAEDEAAHAALSWRFLRWALHIGGRSVHTAATRAFSQALSTPDCQTSAYGDPAEHHFGLLTPGELAAVARDTMRMIEQTSHAALASQQASITYEQLPTARG